MAITFWFCQATTIVQRNAWNFTKLKSENVNKYLKNNPIFGAYAKVLIN